MRTDCHIHLDKIGGPHKTRPPSVSSVVDYAYREAIDIFGGIYEQETTLNLFREAGLTIFGFYWERNPGAPQIPTSANGVKLHPYIEHYVLNASTVGPVMEIARARSMPVLIHSDDRKPDCSRGLFFAKLAEDFPQVTLILAHSGSYAPEWIDDVLVSELVNEAVDAALEHPNIFLEVSILASTVKARILVQRAPLDRVLFGSDFPIRREHCGSVVFQENALLCAGLKWSQIEMIHTNARTLLRF